MNTISSKVLQQAVEELSKLPGVGKRSAMRLALHLLQQDEETVERLTDAINAMKRSVKYCSICNNISDRQVCDICSDNKRDRSTICVVQDIRDVIAIENTSQYKGMYHVLGGVISPMDGVGPSDLEIASLVERVNHDTVTEVIMALNPTVEGDTTNFFIYKQLKNNSVIISTIARGVAVGDELEYADEITLGRSILNRVSYENSLKQNHI
ncbi:MAG: recombination mediator RecR [Bacteroidales bacterium]|nr:recombination mediator RecR [Bacteroidales bacterium]